MGEKDFHAGTADTLQTGHLGPTPPSAQLPPKGQRVWVDRPEQLVRTVQELQAARIIAIDAEFTQARSHAQVQHRERGSGMGPRLALLQLAIDRRCFVIDSLRLNDLSPLQAIVENPAYVFLFHGAGADMRFMAERGLHVAHYFDLEATSRSIFGQHESSLAAMLQRAFHMRLDKSLQRTDWTRRPLPPAMIAYAARDAEVTLALYHWLNQYYQPILKLHENTDMPEQVASWIEPFLRGSTRTSAEMAIAEARQQGAELNEAQMYDDCRAALTHITHPMRKNRLLRLIADLSLTELVPDILPLLQAPTSEERSGCARALGRLGAQSAREQVALLLQDPVYDVRKSAQTALDILDGKDARQPRTTSLKTVDGVRSWVVEQSDEQGDNSNEDGWKARLRSLMEP